MNARLLLGEREFALDLSRPVSLAREQDFSLTGPRYFGAPAASSRPLVVPGFSGAVASGASCNCQTLLLTPHCNGTHTECVGHLTLEHADAWRVVPAGLIPARVVTVEATPAESGDDVLITRAGIEAAWPSEGAPFEARALVLRTRVTDRAAPVPPYLSADAAECLVNRGIEHLVVDLPSVDRTQDGGRLAAHRIFFGLPPESITLAHAQRPQATITELAIVPDELEDGWHVLELQVLAMKGDAVPSRPLVYRVS